MHKAHTSRLIEPTHTEGQHLLCWKSIISGILLSVLVFMVLTAIGAGIFGTATQNIIEQESNGGVLATGAGLWLGLSMVISLFFGSYFSVRISKSVTPKIGAAHGLVVASLFFVMVLIEAGSAVGHLSRGLGRIVEGLGQGTSDIAADITKSPIVQDTVHKALSGVTLKSPPKEVIEGLTLRLIQGNTESAKAYFVYQTGLSSVEVDSKLNELKANFDRAAKETGEKAGGVLAEVGYALTVTFLVGIIGALLGGVVASRENNERPLAVLENAVVVAGSNHRRPVLAANQRGNALPYIFAWLLGVPMSVLFMFYLLRAVF